MSTGEFGLDKAINPAVDLCAANVRRLVENKVHSIQFSALSVIQRPHRGLAVALSLDLAGHDRRGSSSCLA